MKFLSFALFLGAVGAETLRGSVKEEVETMFVPRSQMALEQHRRLGDGQQFLPGLNIYEYVTANHALPDCDTPGQNEAFQGAPLRDRHTGECVRINICHGNAGQHGWNAITVARDSLDPLAKNGHAHYEHNYSNQKNPDYFPWSYSIPNVNGAGANNVLVQNGNGCSVVDLDTPAPTDPPAPTECTDPKPFARDTTQHCYPTRTATGETVGHTCMQVVGQEIQVTIQPTIYDPDTVYETEWQMVQSQLCQEAVASGANPLMEFSCICNSKDLLGSSWTVPIPNRCTEAGVRSFMVHLIAKAKVAKKGVPGVFEMAYAIDHTLTDPDFLSYVYFEMGCGC